MTASLSQAEDSADLAKRANGPANDRPIFELLEAIERATAEAGAANRAASDKPKPKPSTRATVKPMRPRTTSWHEAADIATALLSMAADCVAFHLMTSSTPAPATPSRGVVA